MITIHAEAFGQDPHDGRHPSRERRPDPERHFADDGDALHAHYTSFAEAEAAVIPLWLGSHPDVTVALTFLDPRTGARRDLTLSGPVANRARAIPSRTPIPASTIHHLKPRQIPPNTKRGARP